ncbi:MAG: PRC-barrel domain-containing protein [Candidatus Peregrinibacteria bacterium]|nr:PRC-barrel domain-containing protein [Candidatus Peregrinibacteria bacterium]
MEMFYSNIVGTLVFEDDSPRPVAVIKDLVMDPDRGALIAFVVNQNKGLVVSPMDVISFKQVMKINNADNVVEAAEILRVSEVLKSDRPIFGAKVFTKSGEYLGKVFDFSIDAKTYDLNKIFAAKDILGLFRYNSLIIPAKSIVEVKPYKIIVKDGKETEKEESLQRVLVKEVVA